MPRLKRDEIGITAVPSVHAEAVTKTPVVTESAKRCLQRAVRIFVKCFELLDLSHFYCKRKASEIIIKNSSFISLDAQECKEEDAEFDTHGNS